MDSPSSLSEVDSPASLSDSVISSEERSEKDNGRREERNSFR